MAPHGTYLPDNKATLSHHHTPTLNEIVAPPHSVVVVAGAQPDPMSWTLVALSEGEHVYAIFPVHGTRVRSGVHRDRVGL